MPKSHLGKWSVWLALAFILLFAAGQAIVAIEQDGEEIPVQSDLPAFLAVVSGIAGIGAFVTGIISIFKNRERAIPVFLAVFLGALILWFIAGSLLLGE